MEGPVNDEKKGKYCQNCGNLMDEKAVMCPKCGVMVKDAVPKVGKEDRVGPMAIISLVTGIVSLPCGWFWGAGLLFAIAAIVLGILDLKSINEGRSGSQGRGFDIAGIVCGGLSALSFVVVIVLFITIGFFYA